MIVIVHMFCCMHIKISKIKKNHSYFFTKS